MQQTIIDQTYSLLQKNTHINMYTTNSNQTLGKQIEQFSFINPLDSNLNVPVN